VSEGFVEGIRAGQSFHLGMDGNFISKWIVKNFRTKGEFHSEMDLEKGNFCRDILFYLKMDF
jgi:hypothetical protein